MPDGEDIIEFGELALDLFQARFGSDQQQHAAGRAIVDWYADNGLEVEPAARKQARDMGHGPRVVAHAQFEYGSSRLE